jgi:RNA polymerase sigma-70 factor (ECF subfamily)
VLPPLGLRRAGADSSERVRMLVHEHMPAVWRTARRLGVPEREVDDLAQEVLVVLVRRLADIEPGKERAFLLGTSLRLVQNRRRRQRRRPEEPREAIDELSAGAGRHTPEQACARGEQSVETAQQLALLHAALEDMTEAQREAFVCFELEQLTAKEIAEQLGVTESTVVSRVRRAREVLWSTCERRGYPGFERGGRGSEP